MALQGPFPVEFGAVFPSGVYAAGGFEKVRDFDRSSGDRVIQQADKITGLPLWVVEVIDADPEARQRTVKVKVAAQYQPVLPDAPAGSPFVAGRVRGPDRPPRRWTPPVPGQGQVRRPGWRTRSRPPGSAPRRGRCPGPVPEHKDAA